MTLAWIVVRWALGAAVALIAIPVASASAETWSLTPIDGPPGSSEVVPRAVNASGTVVGGVVPAGSSTVHPFVWQDGTMRVLALPAGAAYGRAQDINANGQIVGEVGESASSPMAASWSSPDAAPQLVCGTTGSSATAINDAGEIAGYSTASFTWRYGFDDTPDDRYTHTSYYPFRGPGCTTLGGGSNTDPDFNSGGFGFGINNAGQVAAWLANYPRGDAGVRFDGTSPTWFPPVRPGPHGMAEDGTIVSYEYMPHSQGVAMSCPAGGSCTELEPGSHLGGQRAQRQRVDGRLRGRSGADVQPLHRQRTPVPAGDPAGVSCCLRTAGLGPRAGLRHQRRQPDCRHRRLQRHGGRVPPRPGRLELHPRRHRHNRSRRTDRRGHRPGDDVRWQTADDHSDDERRRPLHDPGESRHLRRIGQA